MAFSNLVYNHTQEGIKFRVYECIFSCSNILLLKIFSPKIEAINKYETEMHHLPHQAMRRLPCFHRVLCFLRGKHGDNHTSLLAFFFFFFFLIFVFLSFLERLNDISQHTGSGIYSCQLTVFCLLSRRLLQDLLVWGWTKPRHFAEAKGLWDVNLMKTQS